MTVPNLTPRQRQVVRGISDGLTCAQIAAKLGIAVKTVRAHIRAIVGHLPDDDPDMPAMRRIRRAAHRGVLAA